jgi:predicted nuclease of predicted toxin-antitoxin system
MKLLFDQNISYRVVTKLNNCFPGCKHISQVGLLGCEDSEIWMFARTHEYIIVTFDSDFYDISLINGIPPKIIWLRTGNLITNNIADLLKANKDTIDEFINNPEQVKQTCLEIQ